MFRDVCICQGLLCVHYRVWLLSFTPQVSDDSLTGRLVLCGPSPRFPPGLNQLEAERGRRREGGKIAERWRERLENSDGVEVGNKGEGQSWRRGGEKQGRRGEKDRVRRRKTGRDGVRGGRDWIKGGVSHGKVAEEERRC